MVSPGKQDLRTLAELTRNATARPTVPAPIRERTRASSSHLSGVLELVEVVGDELVAVGSGAGRQPRGTRYRRPHCIFATEQNRRYVARPSPGNSEQNVVAAATAALVSGVGLVDLGERRLRDLAGAEAELAESVGRASSGSTTRPLSSPTCG